MQWVIRTLGAVFFFFFVNGTIIKVSVLFSFFFPNITT